MHKKTFYTLTKKMMPGRRFTTGAAACTEGLTKSHSDPYRTEGGGQGGLREERGEEKRERYVKEEDKTKREMKKEV